MDERRLRTFLTVVDQGGVTRAARHLQVTQPSISQTIRSFEEELGATLFDRIGRRLVLTAAGEAFVGPARRIIKEIDDARDALSASMDLRGGCLSVAVLSTLAGEPTARIVARFRERHPGVTVYVVDAKRVDSVLDLVQSGSCEIGVAHLVGANAQLESSRLGQQELWCVLPPGAAEDERPLTLDELGSLSFVASPPGSSTRLLLEQTLRGAQVEPRIAVETGSLESVVSLVLAGAGAALLPRSLARDAERRGAILRRTEPAIRRSVGLVHRPGPQSSAADAFLRIAGLMSRSRP